MSDFEGGRVSHLKSSRYIKGRESNSPTLSSSQSEKSLWARSYKNQPIPTELRKRLIGKRYQFGDNSDSEEEIVAVLEEEEHEAYEQKKTRLSKFKVISDRGEFSHARRSRLSSQRKSDYSGERCRSVSSLKLPQVVEEKREDDELRRRGLSKLAEFRDNNEFGQKRRKRRLSGEYSEVVSKVQLQSLQLAPQLSRVLPQQIPQNDAQQTKSVKLNNQKSMITAQLQKLIVDELDEKRRKKEELHEQIIESIIEEEKHEEEVDTDKLSQSLFKFSSECRYMNNLGDKEDYSRKQEQTVEEEEFNQQKN